MTFASGILTTMASRVPASAELNPYDPAFFAADPHRAFARLRAEDAVHEVRDGVWALTRHADIVRVSRDPSTFCSGRGVLPHDQERNVHPQDSILYMDPPAHLKHRRLVTPGFHPRRVAELESRIRTIAVTLLDALDPSEPVDVVESIAVPLPMLVIAELLGIPAEDRERFRVWSDAMIDATSDVMTSDALGKAAQLFAYFREVIEERRRDPRNDLVSVLANGEVEGERLEQQELLGFCMTLLIAGNETTRNLIGGSVLTLAEYPGERQRVAADPALIPLAVEEMLRWWTPVMQFARTATRGVELRGKTIREGDYVLMLYQSANRDEEVFGPTADQVDVARDPNNHLAFGFAEHFCLGAGLARMEARILLGELLARWPGYELAGTPQLRPSVLMHGLARLPVTLAP
jgi:cytochrome P450